MWHAQTAENFGVIRDVSSSKSGNRERRRIIRGSRKI